MMEKKGEECRGEAVIAGLLLYLCSPITLSKAVGISILTDNSSERSVKFADHAGLIDGMFV